MSPVVLYSSAALLTFVAVGCTALCLAWSIPVWRRRLASSNPQTGGLSGWGARIGSGLVSSGVAGCALVAWYGLYWALAAI